MSLSTRLLVPLLVYVVALIAVVAFSPATVSTPVRPSELGVLALLVAGLAIAIVVTVRGALRPLRTLIAQVEGLDVTDVAHATPLPVPQDRDVAALTVAYNDMIARLAAANEDTALVRLRAQERERAWLGHELHDDIGRRLDDLQQRLDHLCAVRGADETGEVRLVREEARVLAGDCNRLSRELLPGEDGVGLVPSLKAMGQHLRTSKGIDVHMALADPGELSRDAQLVIYRVAQESMSNVVRHSGASKVGMRLVSNPSDVLLEIVDNGHGGVDESGPGLRGMRDRADAVRGRLIVQEVLGDGVRVRLRVPRRRGDSLPPAPTGAPGFVGTNG